MVYYKQINSKYGSEAVQAFKHYNNNRNQKVKAMMDKEYLINCRREKIIPKFIKDRTKQLFQRDYPGKYEARIKRLIQRTRKDILNIEISMTADRYDSRTKVLDLNRQVMYRWVPPQVVNEFIYNQKISGKHYKKNIRTRLEKKLENLRKEGSVDVKIHNNWFMNLTKKHVPSDVKTILSLGNKFTVPHKNKEIPLFDIIADVEMITRSVEPKTVHNTIRSKAATVIANHRHKTDSHLPREKFLLQKMYDDTKKFLRKNEDICIIGADKSNVTIAMYKQEYEDKMNTYFDNERLYRRLGTDPTKRLQNKNNDIVRKLYKDQHLDKSTKRRLITFTARAPKPFATVKLHKTNLPIRVITNGINSPSYNMAKYLNEICKKAVPNTKYNIKNSFELVDRLKNIRLDESDIMVSFDIVAMFNSIPLGLVYKAITKRWPEIAAVTTIPWDSFKSMLKFCLEDTNYVGWNEKTYWQRDGLTIGGCVSAIMADFVITDLIDEVMEESGYDPKLMVKYVDDILAIIPREELENTLSNFNNVNSSLKFTCEIEENRRIPYLDIELIRKSDDTIGTDYYQKPTASNRLLNYKSAHPMTQKISMAYGFISRILTLSEQTYHPKNIVRIIDVLGMNGYPFPLITALIKKFVRRKKFPEIRPESEPTKRFKGMVYIQHLSESLARIFNNYDKTLRIGYRTTKTLGTITNGGAKRIPDMEKHDVIYSIECKNCDGLYIGQTSQKLKNRINQHISDSKQKHVSINSTAAAQHSINTGHSFSFNNATVLDKQSQWEKRLIFETLYINKNTEKAVNLKSDFDSMSPVYTQLLTRPRKQRSERNRHR